MDINKLNEAVEIARDGLKGSLLTTTIWQTDSGMAIAGDTQSDKAVALCNQITLQMLDSLKDAGYPSLSQYYIVNLEGGNKILVLPLDKYQWAVVVNKNCQLGFLLNIMLPKMVDKFEEAIVG